MRFPRFEEEWNGKRLENLIEFKVTNSFSRIDLNYERGSVKNIHYGDIHTKFQTLFDITNEVVPFINEEISIDRISDENYCKEGDIIFADASEDLNDVGKTMEVINLNEEKLLSGLHTLLARAKRSVFHLGFNGYLFKSNTIRKQIQKEAQGTKVLGISIGRLSKITLSFPSVQEQKKIAKFLFQIDKRIKTQNKTIEGLKTIKTAIAKQLFSRELKFKDDNGNEFSKWEMKRLGEVLKERSDKSTSNNQHIILSSTKNDIFIQSEYFTRNIASKNNVGYKILRKNQLVLSPQNIWMGNINLNSKYDVGIVSPSYKIFDFHNSFDPVYFGYHLKQPKLIFEYGQCSEQGASIVRRNLNLSLFLKIRLLVPSLSEQQKIANFLYSLDSKIDIETQLLQKLEEQKKYFLKNLFI